MSDAFDEVFVEGLELKMSIGILPEEQDVTQRVSVNVTAFVRRNASWEHDEIDDVVSYADIAAEVERLAEERRYNLVETFAERIAEGCLRLPKVVQVCVSVDKPDIMPRTKTVGVRIRRSRYSDC